MNKKLQSGHSMSVFRSRLQLNGWWISYIWEISAGGFLLIGMQKLHPISQLHTTSHWKGDVSFYCAYRYDQCSCTMGCRFTWTCPIANAYLIYQLDNLLNISLHLILHSVSKSQNSNWYANPCGPQNGVKSQRLFFQFIRISTAEWPT